LFMRHYTRSTIFWSFPNVIPDTWSPKACLPYSGALNAFMALTFVNPF